MNGEVQTGTEFQPKFDVKVPNAAKNGEVVEFFVESTKDDEDHASVVIRVHEDFAWFLHCLQSLDSVTSVIFPPLPARPLTSLSAAEKITRKQVGSNSSILIGDDFTDSCRAYEEFLQLCVNHPRLGHSSVVEKFICEKEAPARIRVRRNFIGSLRKSVDDIRTSNFKDHNQEFQQARVSNDENVKLMKQAASVFEKVVNRQYRIANSYSEIQSAIKQLASLDSSPMKMDQICEAAGEGVEHAAVVSNRAASNAKLSLGSKLKLYSGFAQSQHDMMQKRVNKSRDLDSAKRTFERAKPNKKQQAEDEMKRLEQELEDMTSLAKPELARHNRQRIRAMQSALLQIAEFEIKTSRDALAVFTKACADVQKITL